MSKALLWFRQDLRLHDNPALKAACEHHAQIIPLYIKELIPSVAMGGAQKWWLYHSLQSLKQSLLTVGLNLFLKQGDPLLLLIALIKEHKIEAVYWNRCYEPAHRQRDQRIKEELTQLGIKVVSYNGSLLNEPWEILNKQNEYFKVFTPYWQHCLRQIPLKITAGLSISRWPSLADIASDELESWQLLPQKPNWAAGFSKYWQPGEKGALAQLNRFLTHHLNDYKHQRNEPCEEATSRLSPHLHFGELSPQQIWLQVQHKLNEPSTNLGSAQNFLTELGWREFSYYLLYHVPTLSAINYKASFNSFVWQNNLELLKLWQKGLTGYPIVDAGMRELWHTGFMHNRVRMIVASFLTKDLLIDWRYGADWFWDTLVDADLASNSASWQWVAGSGADAAPYYRIFNPTLQGEKFDPNGQYVKRWIPELKSVPKKWIHTPWQYANLNYPKPIIDHAVARQRALERYKQMKIALLDDKEHDKKDTEADN